MKQFTRYKQIALAAIAILLVAPTLRASTTYVTNLGDTTTSYFSMNSFSQPSSWLASEFTTDASAPSFTLSSVTISIYDVVSPGSSFSVQVFSSVGAPNTPLGTLSGSVPTAAGLYTYTATGITLNSNTSYWLVAELSGSSTIRWSSTSDTTTGNWIIAPDVLVSSDSGTIWTAPTTSPGSMQYSVAAEAVPEPSTYAILGFGIPAMLGVMRLRQRKA